MFFRILIVACFAFSAAQAQDIQYVYAENGLVVREKPSQGAIKVGLLDYGTAVEIIEHTNLSLDIKDNNKKVTGEWVKVKAIEPQEFFREGYVFNGFLTEKKIESPLKVKFNAFTIFVDELAKDSSLKNAEINEETIPVFKIEEGASPENRYLKVKHHQNYRAIKVFQRYRNSMVITTKEAQSELIDFQYYDSSWKPLQMVSGSTNMFKTLTLNSKDKKRFGDINEKDLMAFIKEKYGETNVSEYTTVPSQIQLKVVMTDIDGYKTEKIVIFELPLKD